MAINTYLAMTAAEYAGCTTLPPRLAWMACHFSPYATGLSNYPLDLPEGSLLIVNDIMPVQKHHPDTVAEQLKTIILQQRCSAVLLDFQRPATKNTIDIVRLLCQTLPCPTGVSSLLANDLDCPVFLSTCPSYRTLESHIAPWRGREIWLEIGLEEDELQIEKDGTKFYSPPSKRHSEFIHRDSELCSHYSTAVEKDYISLCLWRDREDLQDLMDKAEKLGIRKAIGLFQELHNIL